MTAPRIERRIRWSGVLIGLGLTIQMLMLLWIHPLSFMIFLLLGCPMVGIGMLVYLYSLVSHAVGESK
jgi:hypothetical protein